MKSIKYLFSFAIAVVALTLGSCASDFLDTAPTNQVSSNIMFTSPENAMMAINGIHLRMHNNGGSKYGQAGYQMWMITTDMMSDDFVFTKVNAKFTECAQLNWHRSVSNNDWSYFYSFFGEILGNANEIINNIDTSSPDTDATFCYVKGQALTYRALVFYNMTQAMGGRYVPGEANNQLGYILNTESSKEPMARSTVEQCYTQILSDLDEAITLLGKYTKARTNKTHIDLTTAKAIKARVCLTMGKWSEAETLADDVITNGGYKLDPKTYDYAQWQSTGTRMSDASSTEWIWAKIGDDTQAGSLRHFHAFISNNAASYNKNTPRAILNLLYNQIPQSDVRKTIWFPNAQGSTTHTYANPDGVKPTLQIPSSGNRFNYMSNKFLVPSGSPSTKTGDVPYVRLPEMYLIKAEAACRLSHNDVAQQTIYDFATTRDAAFTKPSVTGQELLDIILFQRRVELWGEGFRFFDLKRLNVDLDRGPAPDISKYPGSDLAWASKKATTKANGYNVDPKASNYNMYDTKGIGEDNRYRSKDSNFWQFLFPTVETLVNPLCEQNPTGNDN